MPLWASAVNVTHTYISENNHPLECGQSVTLWPKVLIPGGREPPPHMPKVSSGDLFCSKQTASENIRNIITLSEEDVILCSCDTKNVKNSALSGVPTFSKRHFIENNICSVWWHVL